MSKLKKDHIVGTGASALTGGVVGAVIGGAVAGPPGIALGAAAGTALGAAAGQKVSEAADARGDLGHFEQIFRTMPYYVSAMAWSDYAPAYRYGLTTHERLAGQPFAQAQTELEQGWPSIKGGSRLLWSEASEAVAHAWRSLDDIESAPSAKS
ncbi:MAG: hypothetical protein ABJA62_05700 [Luteimonas sp.]